MRFVHSARSQPGLAGAFFIDALGTGMFLPFSLLYFLATTSMSLTQIGLGLSIAAVVRIPATIAAGPVSDRFGPRAAVVASQLLQAAGFASYLFAGGFWHLVAATVLYQAGNSLFWVAYPPLIFAIADGQREHWFALVAALQGAGIAAGGVIAGAAVAFGGRAGFTAVAAADAASYVLAAALCLKSRPRTALPGRDAAPRPERAGGWKPMLRDHPFLGFVTLSMGFTFLAMACEVALPVFLVKILGLPTWAPGTALALTATLVTFSAPTVMSAISGRQRHRVLMASQALMIAAFAVFLLLHLLPAGAAIALVLIAVLPLAASQIMQAAVVPALVTESAGPAALGRYMSAYQLTFSIADIIVPAIVSTTLHAGGDALWLILAAIAFADLASVSILSRRMPPLTRRVGEHQTESTDTEQRPRQTDEPDSPALQIRS